MMFISLLMLVFTTIEQFSEVTSSLTSTLADEILYVEYECQWCLWCRDTDSWGFFMAPNCSQDSFKAQMFVAITS